MLSSSLLSAFGLIFVAELGDKTQLAVLAQTCKYRRPWPIFIGASLALTAVTAIGAAGGRALSLWVPQHILRTAAAFSFVVMGLLMGRNARSRSASNQGSDPTCDLAVGSESAVPKRTWSGDWRAFGTTLGLLFVAEFGDKTQLAVLSLASKSQTPWAVFAGAALALTSLTALGVAGGQGLSRIIPQHTLHRLSAVAFVAMGVLTGLGVL
jgi:putative Ca2+/H+ antiporter (TMEM165/GDT1 family)